MNERIEQLAKKHGLIHIHMSTGEYNDTLKKFEKFAELIVGECVQVIKDCEKYGHDKPLEFEVMEHFGVEE